MLMHDLQAQMAEWINNYWQTPWYGMSMKSSQNRQQLSLQTWDKCLLTERNVHLYFKK